MQQAKVHFLRRLTPMLIVAFGLTIGMLLACAPGVPIVSQKTQQITLTNVLGEQVTVTIPIGLSPTIATVCDSYIKNQIPENFERNPPTSPIHWTINFNFKATNQEGVPVGCFRIYERKMQNNSPIFEHIDNGGFVIDTCHGKPPKIELTEAITPTAIFDGNSYLECAINISQWVAALSRKQQLSPSSPDLLSNLVRGRSERYENFTMYARSTISTSNIQRFPIIFYEPMDSSQSQVGMSLHVNSFKTQEYISAWLRGQHFTSEDECSLDPPTKILDRWIDFRTDKNPDPHSTLEFQWGDPVNRRCPAAPEITPPGEQTTTIDFWIGPAKLYIGYWPESAPQEEPLPTPGTTLFGTLQEVLIDPCDAKPGGG